MFSFVPRCQGLCGSQKYTWTSLSTLKQRDFESNHVRGRLMPAIDEPVVLADHFGVSGFESLEALRSRLRWAEFAAQLQMPDDIPIAKTFGPWHWTIWGRPEVLVKTVAQIVRL